MILGSLRFHYPNGLALQDYNMKLKKMTMMNVSCCSSTFLNLTLCLHNSNKIQGALRMLAQHAGSKLASFQERIFNAN